MNKEKKMLSHLRQKERKRLRWNKHYLDSYHYPKDDIYKVVTTNTCLNCESLLIEDGKLMCDRNDDYQPLPFVMFCERYSYCGKDRLHRPCKIVDLEG